MRKLHTRQGGFTLIELMIVVAIIGILAAIAIPNFLRFQLRAKSSEGKTNLAAIRTAEEGYSSEFGTYVLSTGSFPASVSTAKTPWPSTAGGFDTIGWGPEGDVYFQYDVVGSKNGGAAYNVFTAHAVADLDGDGTNQEWGYVHPLPNGTSAMADGKCPASGVFNPVTQANDLESTVGPCDSKSGQSVF